MFKVFSVIKRQPLYKVLHNDLLSLKKMYYLEHFIFAIHDLTV